MVWRVTIIVVYGLLTATKREGKYRPVSFEMSAFFGPRLWGDASFLPTHAALYGGGESIKEKKRTLGFIGMIR